MRRSPSSVILASWSGAGLQLDGAVARDVDLELVVENDAGVEEASAPSRIRWEQAGVDGGDDLVFQDFARTQAGHGDVLLVIVGVDGSFAGNRRGEVLDGAEPAR